MDVAGVPTVLATCNRFDGADEIAMWKKVPEPVAAPRMNVEMVANILVVLAACVVMYHYFPSAEALELLKGLGKII
jgi:hypothetical protein